MANENNKINELVAEDDDDPTAELDVSDLRETVLAEAAIDDAAIDDADTEVAKVDVESDTHTFGVDDGNEQVATHGQSIPELQQDLNRRTKTISRLQYDIEQLRSKWLGLEAEIGAREDIVSNLNREVDELKDEVSDKDKRLKKRDKELKKLKAEVESLSEKHGPLVEQHKDLEQQLANHRAAEAVQIKALEEALVELEEARADRDSARAAAADLDTDIAARGEVYLALEQKHTALAQELEEALRDLEGTRSELDSAQAKISVFEADIEARDEAQRQLEHQQAKLNAEFETLRSTDADNVSALEKTVVELRQTQGDLDSALKNASALGLAAAKQQEVLDRLEQKNLDLNQQLEELRKSDARKGAALDAAELDLEKTRLELEAALNQGPPEFVLSNISASEAEQIEAQVARTEEYADSLRHRLEDLTETYSAVSKDRDELRASLQLVTARNQDLVQEIGTAIEAVAELKSALAEHEADSQAAYDRMYAEKQAAHEQLQAESHAAYQKLQEDSQAKYEQLQAEGQASYAQLKKQSQAAYDQLKTTSQSSYKQLQAEKQAAYEQLKAESEKAYQQLRAESEKAYEQLQAESEKGRQQLQAEHDQEIRTLRFELQEAQSTVSETGDLNTQLAAELLDTRVFKDDLEDMLQQKEVEAQQRIEELEKQIERLTEMTEDFEQKLETKSTAINVLLEELAQKSEQMDSISEIEQVIQDIDDRMSGHVDEEAVESEEEPLEPTVAAASSDRDRVTRVLVGEVGDQILQFPLFKTRLTIGRTNENDIQLKTSFVSRRHAVILTEGDSARVIDWGSTNGVFVNSERIKEHYLSNGDILSVGDAEFRYEERQKRDA